MEFGKYMEKMKNITIWNIRNRLICQKTKEDLLETEAVCSKIINEFGEAYIGDAKAEIDTFLSSLSAHLQRLAAFYYKMSDYLMTTSDSFKQTDYGTAQNMEG